MLTGLLMDWWSRVRSVEGDEETCEHANALQVRSIAARRVAADWDCHELWADAEQAMRAWLASLKKHVDDDHPATLSVTLSTLHDLAKTYHFQRKFLKAEELHRQVLAASRRAFGEEHGQTLCSARNVAKSLVAQGSKRKCKEANAILLETLRTTLETLRTQAWRFGELHPDTMKSAHWLAISAAGQGHHRHAALFHHWVLDRRRELLGREHPKTLASASAYARSLSRQGRHLEAEKLARDVLAIQLRVLGEAHPNTEDSADLLYTELSHQGKHAEAERLMRRVLRVHSQVLGWEHPNTRGRARDLAISLGNQGRYTEAEEITWEVIRVNEELLEEGHAVPPMYNVMLKDYVGALLYAQGRHAAAERIHRELDPFRRAGADNTRHPWLRPPRSKSEPKVHCAHGIHLADTSIFTVSKQIYLLIGPHASQPERCTRCAQEDATACRAAS